MQCFNKLVPSRENDFQDIILGLVMVSFQIKLNIVLMEQTVLQHSIRHRKKKDNTRTTTKA